jgi:hypothetical protein
MRLRTKKAPFAGKTRASLPKIVSGAPKKEGGGASFPSAK